MHPLVANALRWHIWLAQAIFGFTPRLVSGFRTHEQQHELFRTAATRSNPVAVPGSSQHEYGFAYDLAPEVLPGSPLYSQQIRQLRETGLSLGMRWGGAGDPQHWQAFSRAVWTQLIGFRAPQRGVL